MTKVKVNNMDIITAYATKNDCYKAATPLTPKGIVVHSTGANNPNLKRYVDCESELGKNQYGNHWNNPSSVLGRQVCVHAFLGYDKNNKVRVAQILPYAMACWGVGGGSKGSFNYDPVGHIQFEMCEDDLTNATYFNEMWKVAVEYCVFLCDKFGFDPLGKDVIVSHKEAHALGYGSNHGDPHNWFVKHGKTMDDFRAAVKAGLDAKKAPEPEKPSSGVLYRVQVGAYSVKANAETQLAKVKAAGFDTYMVTVGNLYKIQVGAYSKKENADATLAKLKAKGFDAFITTQGGTAANSGTTQPPVVTFAVGDKVKMTKDAPVYGKTSKFASWVYSSTLYVREINGDRIVISTVKTGDITGAVDKKYLVLTDNNSDIRQPI